MKLPIGLMVGMLFNSSFMALTSAASSSLVLKKRKREETVLKKRMREEMIDYPWA